MELRINGEPKSQPEEIRKGKVQRQWIVAVILNTASMMYGMQMAWPASAASVLQSASTPTDRVLSTIDISWLASTPNLAAMFSIPVWTLLVDRIGRKKCFIVVTIMHASSWLFLVFGSNFPMLMTSRVVAGVSGGGCTYVLPMYIRELSQDSIRGALGMLRNIARPVGILAIYVMGGVLSYFQILWISLALSIVCVIVIFLAPESPTFFVKTGQPEIAAETISYMRSLTVEEKVVQAAIDSIKAEDEKFKSIPNVSFITIFEQKTWRRGFIFMMLVMFCHGMNGGFALISYAPSILRMFGVTFNPELQSVGIPIFMMFGCMCTMVLIDRLGRKPLLAGSFFLSLVSFSVLAAMILVQQNGGNVPGWVAVVVIVVPVFAYSAAVSPMPFVIMAEMFNFQIRAKIMGCLGMMGWAAVFVQAFIFGPLTTAYGLHASLFLYAAVNLIGTLAVLILIPETKKKSVHEIEMELENKFKT